MSSRSRISVAWTAIRRRLAYAGAVIVVLYVGDFFSLKQSFAIGLCILVAMEFATWLAWPAYEEMRRAQEFQPYYVQITPSWYDLLTDFKLIRSDEEWRSISQSLEKIAPDEYRVLRSGLRYTVLDERQQRRLVYWNNHSAFRTTVNLWADLEPVGIEPDQEHAYLRFTWRDRGGKIDVEFFCQLGLIESPRTAGYLLGLVVPDWWWQKNRADCPKPIHEDNRDVPLTGQVRLAVAVIPYAEFGVYHGIWSNLTLETRDQILKQLGWKRDERDTELLGAPESIEHKYFTVEHREI